MTTKPNFVFLSGSRDCLSPDTCDRRYFVLTRNDDDSDCKPLATPPRPALSPLARAVIARAFNSAPTHTEAFTHE